MWRERERQRDRQRRRFSTGRVEIRLMEDGNVSSSTRLDRAYYCGEIGRWMGKGYIDLEALHTDVH
jgi:hypothetical protein